MNILSDQIRQRRDKPLIAVVGSTNPDLSYDSSMGIGLGYALRDFIDKRTGTIFTGGVNGVGVDVHTGIMKYCIRNADHGNMPEDRFFVLIPHKIEQEAFGFTARLIDEPEFVTYNPPGEYEVLARLSKRGSLDIERAGEEMYERRVHLAEISDVVIVANGSFGTLHEVYTCLAQNKPAISLPFTGGVAKILSAFKNGLIPGHQLDNFGKKAGVDLSKMDPDLIHLASDTEEVKKTLVRLL